MNTRNILVSTALMTSAWAASAAEIVFYDFDNVVIGGVPQTTLVNLPKREATFDNGTEIIKAVTGSPWTAGIGSVLTNGGIGAPGGSTPTNRLAVGVGVTKFVETVLVPDDPNPPIPVDVFAFDPAQTLGFNLQVAPGFKIDLTDITFSERFGGGGNAAGALRTFQKFQLNVNGVFQGEREVLLGSPESFTSQTLSLNLSGLTGDVSLRFSFLGPFGTVGSGLFANQGGSWRVDNFQLNGNVSAVPVPAGLWLLASGLGALVGARRRAA